MPSYIHKISRIHRIACIPGDGIGVNITDTATTVLTKLAKVAGGFEFDFTTFD
ncbi:hypothetical protein NX059_007210 [Plenodomus lindquistii]|nr:hypothetical protein NX059_007210 [Plenodomus lindquistii]